ncbi:hypothetical protein B0T11DRAFT_277925 [Plectosphaerella cucumerina]|uniref:DUF1746 domain-containing protein n=1 Tax=Plectosphaerella cucumerina TaxID=40658 RepID=A0A8K0TLB7_9PEZI|nr:hypothetical protein B0T11DRAFT_277925 [Plectosphaerella cucumerina]
MNNDASPLLQAHTTDLNDADPPGDATGGAQSTAQHASSAGAQQTRRRRRRKTPKADQGLVKKFEFLTHLLKNLDMLVYVELAALYYMECSALRFFLRGWCQQNFLSPKSDDWPIPLPAIQAQVLSVFVPSFLCVLAHILEALPSAGEAARGYMHGGVIVDFIGQTPPSTKWTLLAFDFFILGLQCLMLSVHEERERLRKIIRPKRTRRTGAAAGTVVEEPSTGDAEEQARANSTNAASGSPSETPDGIEMQSLSGQDQATENDERQPFLETSRVPSTSRTTFLDVMSSGNGMIRDFHVIHTLRNATPDFWGAVGHVLRSAGYQAALARIRARVGPSTTAARNDEQV